MAELELQQVKCPSCKRVISSFSPFQAQVECPYCHNKAFNPLITAKKVPMPERIIMVSLTEDDFEKEMIKALVDTDFVPADIFEHLTADKIFKAYLPMFLYEGAHDTSFSWKLHVQSKDTSFDQPQSSSLKENFAFMSLAYDGDEIPPELTEFARWLDYDPMQSKEYEPSLLGLTGGVDDPTTLALNTDREIIWNQFAKRLLSQHIVEEITANQKPSGDIKDFKVGAPVITLTSSRYVLAPVWFVYYNYNNEKYHFIMDGTGDKLTLNYPVNKEEQKNVKTLRTLGTVLAIVCAAICLFIKTGNFFTWLLLVAVPAIAIYVTFHILANNKLKKSHAQREAGAKKLMGE